MRCVVFGVFVLMMMSGVFAMDEPIRVQADDGNEVKIYVWPGEGGQVLNLDKGLVDDDGFFETTFFSLNVENYRLQIMVLDSGTKVRDSDFLNMKTDKPVFINCLSSECVVDVWKVENVSDVVKNESILIEGEEPEVESASSYLTGKVTDVKDSFSYWWYFLVGALVMVGVFMMMKRGYKSKGVVSDDDRELEYMEKRVNETEVKIGKIKAERDKLARIEAVKMKLKKEESELQELEGSKGEVDEVKKE
ncbi:hypothetical protein HN903_01715 [archaeon]|jgi:hypothetical protein|nr:hypothetical protein [archaeon]MBT7128450.1 hypothetical protein [archaeon]